MYEGVVFHRHNCHRGFARRYISTIFGYYLAKQRTSNIDSSKWLYAKKRQGANDILMITDADYADDLALLANTHAQHEFLLHSLERAAGGTGIHVNSNKTEFMCFKREAAISKSSSSSSCHTASTDILDPLSPILPIVHRLWQVFRATSRILT